jgi:hypothetical protein
LLPLRQLKYIAGIVEFGVAVLPVAGGELHVFEEQLFFWLKAPLLSRFHGPRLRRDDENHGLRPNVRLDALSQCASDSGYVFVGITVIHGVRKTAFTGSSLDLPVPVVFLHISMEIFIILPAGSTAELNTNK